MYGVPKDLPLQRFVGDALFQIALGIDGIHLTFGHSGTIAVEGHWQLVDASGSVVDRYHEPEQRDACHLHGILNAIVTACRIDPPRSFSITFSTGHQLTVYDDSPQYEAFHIYPDDIHV